MPIPVGKTAIAIKSRDTGKSILTVDCDTAKFPPEIKAPVERINVASRMFAPIIFPIESAFCFFTIAAIDVTISGRDVPIATNVRPITASETPN